MRAIDSSTFFLILSHESLEKRCIYFPHFTYKTNDQSATYFNNVDYRMIKSITAMRGDQQHS